MKIKAVRVLGFLAGVGLAVFFLWLADLAAQPEAKHPEAETYVGVKFLLVSFFMLLFLRVTPSRIEKNPPRLADHPNWNWAHFRHLLWYNAPALWFQLEMSTGYFLAILAILFIRFVS